MNNRIMAMLFALVAAMFISIVPVKAEAATCKHPAAKIEEIAAKEATCSEEGNNRYFRCTACTEVFKDQKCTTPTTAANETIAKKPHTYGNYTYTDTQHTEVCSVCKGQLKVAVNHDKACIDDKNGTTHSWSCKTEGCNWTVTAEAHVDTNKDCVCDYCDAKLEHNWADWGKDATHHWKSCLNTNCSEKNSVGEHNFKVTSKKDGLKHTKTCKDCGYVVEENCNDGDDNDCKCDTCKQEIKHDTSWKRMESVYKDPTCTETGLMQHWKCKVCGLLLNSSNEVVELADVTSDALGHSYQKGISCDDNYHYYRCTRTGCEEKDQAAEHELVYTSNHDGTHSGKCKVCNRAPAAAQKLAHVDADKDCVCDDCKVNLDHKLVDVLAVEPACEKEGVVAHKKCETCGKLFSKVDGRELKAEEVVRAALVHTPNGKWEKDDNNVHYQWCANNCGTKLLSEEHVVGDWKLYPSDNSKHFHQCSVCYKTVETEAHTYTYEYVNETYHAPTCEACGYKANWEKHKDENKDCLCDGCGSVMPHVRADLEYVARHEATCTEDGNVGYYHCQTCGLNFEKDGDAFVKCEKDVVLEKLGHDWVARKDTLNGQHLQKCARCSEYQTLDCQDLDGDCLCDINDCNKLIHSHKKVFHKRVEATCETDGTEGYYTYQECDKAMFNENMEEITAPVVIPATGHTADENWVPAENGKHVQHCKTCGEVVAEEAHDFSAGTTCPVCGAYEKLTRVPAKEATCYEEGNIEYWYALNGSIFADSQGVRKLTAGQEKIAKLEHTLVWEPMDDGLRHQQVCKNEGCTYQPVIQNHSSENSCYCAVCDSSKGGHTIEMVQAVPATCAQEGTQAHFKCSCGKLYDLNHNAIDKAPSIAKLKHEMDTTVKKDTKLGKHYIECKHCDYKMYEEHAMQMSDPNKGNYHQWLCACGELEIETHYDKDGDNKCDVCGHSTNGSNQTTTVEQHDNQTVTTSGSASKGWLQNWLENLIPGNSGGTAASTAQSQTTTNGGSTATNNSGNASTSNGGNAATSNSGNAAVNNGGSTTAGAAAASGSTTTAVTAAQTNVITQFISWFLGLFGF